MPAKGHKLSQEAKDHLRKINTGKKTSDKTKELLRQRSNEMWHKDGWRDKFSGIGMRGKSFTRDHKDKISKANSGKPKSDEHRKKLSEVMSGKPSYHRTESHKENMRTVTISRLQKNPGPLKDTTIERTVASELIARDVSFEFQYKAGPFLVDFFIPSMNTVIECDGCYWHCCELCRVGTMDSRIINRIRNRDSRRSKILLALGYRIVRLWEHEINLTLDKCMSRILNTDMEYKLKPITGIKVKPMSDSDIMPFGAHKGKKLRDVPASYLLWAFHEFASWSIHTIGVWGYIVTNFSAIEKDEDAADVIIKKPRPTQEDKDRCKP